MKTIALVAQKGGTGKSTMAMHLAVCASREGKSVALIDLDEGVRMMSNLVKDEPDYPSIDPDDVTIGMKVRVAWPSISAG